MGAGWDINTTFAFWSLVVGIVGLLFGACAFLPGWAEYRDWLKADPDYRAKTAAALRDRRWVEGYRGWLEAGLDWLDRRFGEANSSRALGVCTVISLCYAWAAFFIGYGMGTPGRLGEIELLPASLGPADRWTLVALAVVLPVVAFFVGRWLGGIADRGERRFKARLLKKRRRRAPSITRRRFERRYRLISALIVLALLMPGLAAGVFVDEDHPLFAFFGLLAFAMLIVSGPIFGLAVAKRVQASWLNGPAAGVA